MPYNPCREPDCACCDALALAERERDEARAEGERLREAVARLLRFMPSDDPTRYGKSEHLTAVMDVRALLRDPAGGE